MRTDNTTWRTRFLNIVLILGFGVLLAFARDYYLSDRELVSFFELGIAILLLITYFALKKQMIGWQNGARIGWIGIALILIIVLRTGGIGGIGMVWWGLLPMISYMFFERVGGTIATGLALTMMLGAYLAESWGIDLSYYTPLQLRVGMMMIVVYGIIMYFFEVVSSNLRESVLEQAKKLEAESMARQQAETELSEKLKILEQNHQKDDKIRTAVLNILVDERELELALKKEKEGVEAEVKRQTRALVEEKAKFVASIEGLVRAYVLFDSQRKVVLSNSKLREHFPELKTDWKIDDLIEQIQPNFDIKEAFKKAFENNEKVTVAELPLKDRFYDLFITPVMDETHGTNNLIGVVMMAGDITERKILERSKDEFFSIASHELRTPLTAIRGNAEMIIDNYKDKIPDKDVQEMLEDIHTGSVRLIEIVNDFLNTSRLEMGKVEFKIEPCEIKKLALQAVEELESSASEKQVKLEVVGEEIKAMADNDRLHQVITNLIGNALKFSEKSVIKVNIFVNEEKMVQISVVDNGAGIPKEQQALLFRKFQQAGSSLYTRDTSKGTGLGLYISKMLVEGMKGKIWLVKSEVGKGSEFAVSLPLA